MATPPRLLKYVIDKLRGPSEGVQIDSSWINTATLPGTPPLPVAQTVSALKVISNIAGQYDYADPSGPIAASAVVGISLQSVNAGGLLTPVNNQTVSSQSWAWVRGSPVFLGTGGSLTQTPPTAGYLVVVARVFSPQTLFVHIEDPIAL